MQQPRYAQDERPSRTSHDSRDSAYCLHGLLFDVEIGQHLDPKRSGSLQQCDHASGQYKEPDPNRGEIAAQKKETHDVVKGIANASDVEIIVSSRERMHQICDGKIPE